MASWVSSILEPREIFLNNRGVIVPSCRRRGGIEEAWDLSSDGEVAVDAGSSDGVGEIEEGDV